VAELLRPRLGIDFTIIPFRELRRPNLAVCRAILRFVIDSYSRAEGDLPTASFERWAWRDRRRSEATPELPPCRKRVAGLRRWFL